MSGVKAGPLAVISLFCMTMLLVQASAAPRPAQYRYTETPSAPQYPLPVDPARITNSDALDALTASQTAALSQNGFVVIPDQAIQMFYLYEEYSQSADNQAPTPNYITVDSLLHAYHLFFDYTLRSAEETYLVDACEKLSKICAYHNDKFSATLPDGELRKAARANTLYFSIAWSLSTGTSQTRFLKTNELPLFEDEMQRVNQLAGRSQSPLMGNTVHYDQFRPRGHYTRSERLERYFRTMTWYGTVAMDLDAPLMPPELLHRHQLQALLITKILKGDDIARTLWAKIYEPTQFYVGGSDDLGYREYSPLSHTIYGADMQLTAMQDASKLDDFIAQARRTLPKPQIAPFFRDADDSGALSSDMPQVQGRQFRFMGQRFIPDSYMLQNLVSPKVSPNPADPSDARDMPMGLDVMSVLGSARAYKHLIDRYDQGRFPRYQTQMASLRDEFFAYPEDKWWSNLYWGWIYSLSALLEDWGQQYPSFMKTNAYADKCLNTSLASWAQLRHDTILYAKPSGAEMGGDDPLPVRGYVEPVPEAWGRLAYLTKLSRDGLAARNLLSDKITAAFARYEDTLLFLKTCSEKELRGLLLTPEEYKRIQYFGGELERLQLTVATDEHPEWGGTRNWYQITSEVDRNIATVADVHTSFGAALEEAVGYGFRIYVIVPDPNGGLQVTKGGVFSYYEFAWPVSDRLTDEKWLQLLKAGQAPPQPEWTTSFIAN